MVLVGGAIVIGRGSKTAVNSPPEPPPMTVDVVNATRDAHVPPPPRRPTPGQSLRPELVTAEVSEHLIDDVEQPTQSRRPSRGHADTIDELHAEPSLVQSWSLKRHRADRSAKPDRPFIPRLTSSMQRRTARPSSSTAPNPRLPSTTDALSLNNHIDAALTGEVDGIEIPLVLSNTAMRSCSCETAQVWRPWGTSDRRLSGPDARRFTNGMFTNNIRDLKPGERAQRQ